MILWLLYVLIKSIESYHSLNSSDILCKKHDYQLITDQSSYIIDLDNPLLTIHASIGFDNKLTELWHGQINQQPLILQSSWNQFRINGEFENSSWNFKLSLDSFIHSKSNLYIQSTLFNKQIDLIIRKKERDQCSYPNSPVNFAICCGLCTIPSNCPDVKILHEHSRYDMIVTNYGLIILQPFKEYTCSLYPSNQTTRFWSTITNSMNIGQILDQNDLAIIQHPYGMIENFFYYSFYPFHQWTKQILNFHFLDVLFIPSKQLSIFQLNQCEKTSCKMLLRIYDYKFHKTLELNNELYSPEIIIVSPSTYFHFYFNILSNILYLIGKQSIYASMNYGIKLIRIWTDDLLPNDSIILNPIIFSDTGHIAFIYQLNNHTSCCFYFAIFSKTGVNYAWRTRIFHSSISLNQPFFFDSTGSFYFNTTPPLVIIQATEQSLVATSHLLVNHIPGPFFLQETDMNRVFIFCSLTAWDNRFELIGSTLRFDKLGLFFVINMEIPSLQFPFCLQTSRLDDEVFQTSRYCQLMIHFNQMTKKVHLKLSTCIFNNHDENSTIITSKFPNIFIDQIINDTFAIGRIFQETKIKDLEINQWNLINIQVDQIFDRCLLQNLNQNPHRPSIVYLYPTSTYPIALNDELVTKNISFLIANDYKLFKNEMDNNIYLISSLFDNKKSIIHQEFLRNQISCYLPLTRITMFITKCLANIIIRPRFLINKDLSKLIPIKPPMKYESKLKNCSSVKSLIVHQSIHCAEQFYTIDSTVNNRVYMELWMENDIVNNRSIFLIEEISKRYDYRLIDNLWTEKMKEEKMKLFLKNIDDLTENEIKVFATLNISKYVFLGPNIKLELMDEGLYHFRISYLWGDKYCLTSTDLLILMISNTPTLMSYTYNYYFSCIIILILMIILWIIQVIVYEKISKKYFYKLKTEKFFQKRLINENVNLEMLVKIREQSQKFLPYQHLILTEVDN